VPDVAVGRIPATTVAQAEAVIGKILAWEQRGQGLSGKVAFVADNTDAAGDFEGDVADIRASFFSGQETEVLTVRELGANTRPAIQAAFDGGLSLMSYVGHGGAAVWASENVWNSWDAPKLLAQSQQPVLLTINCMNGYFTATAFDSLAESLLKVQGRGAVAVLSPSGLSVDGPAHEYHRALVKELVAGGHERLGDAVVAAQRAYAETGLMPELLSVYTLLGDPGMRIR
jgi:Peptidase family C25